MDSEKPLQIARFGELPSQSGLMIVHHFSKQERVIRAAKFFGAFFGAGVAFIFVPVLHFIFVPLCAILAPTSAVIVFLQTEEITSATATCPYCTKQTPLPRAKLVFPFRDSCTECRQLLEVSSA